jgi:hypothetical protein
MIAIRSRHDTKTFPRFFKPVHASVGAYFGFGGPLAALPVYIALHYSQMPTDMYPSR